MKSSRSLLAIVFLAIAALPAAFADDSFAEAEKLEQERQAAFQTQMQLVVESLNLGSFDVFMGAIDRSDFLDRIYGLRLIDPRLKRDFNETMELQFEGLIRDGFRESGEEIEATLLGVESSGERGRAVVRYDLPDLQFGYHEYDLALNEDGELQILDWIDWLYGERFTDTVGNSLVMASPSESAVRKMVDFQNITSNEIFQLRELLKSGRDRQVGRYSQIYQDLDERIRRQRVVVLQNVQLSRAVNNRRYLREALVVMDQYFPEEPLFSLMLLDYYVPTRQYQEALDGLQRTYDKFGFEDAAMEARLSAIALAMENDADAGAYAERATLIQPGLELGWWSTLRASVATQDYERATTALQRLEDDHGHTLRSEQLQADKSFAEFLASDEFKTWEASR